ncbi:MAG: hypothetical protein JNK76_01630, partial [Planctomycetales bacterium]|nr:hypothetical protein [Planctomycetales bacterium]
MPQENQNNERRSEDLCPRPDVPPAMPTEPLVTPIYQAAVYRCDDP